MHHHLKIPILCSFVECGIIWALSTVSWSPFFTDWHLCLRGCHEVDTMCLRRRNCSRMNLRVVIIKIFLIMGVELRNRSPEREGICIS